MAITGFTQAPPLLSPGDPAGYMRSQLDAMRFSASRWGRGLIDSADERLLGERAAFTGASRNAPFSVGNAFRVLATHDGFVGLSLARTTDIELVPALISARQAPDAWASVAAWLCDVPTIDAVHRARALGLPLAPVWPPPPATAAVRASPGGTRTQTPAPLVLDFSSLWAGPLCAQLLGASGARVVKVESRTRPDGARRGSVDFYQALHAGHDAIAIDPDDAHDRQRLADLVARADVIIEASRPHALAAWGLSAADAVADGTIWASITAYGRDIDAVGFGDDVAAAGGLWRDTERGPVVMGDAIADPLTGVTAAAAVSAALTKPHGTLLDIAMVGVVQQARGSAALADHEVIRLDNDWWVDDGTARHQVRSPYARPAPTTGWVAAVGADNARWLI